MKQAEFERHCGADWRSLELLLEALESRKTVEGLKDLPDLYRRLVRQHALAVDRHYSPGLVDRLQQLLQRAHRQLYRSPEPLLTQTLAFLAYGFPSAVRRHARLFWLATAMFYLPALALGVWTYHQSDAVYHVLDPISVASMEYAYDPANEHPGRGAERQSSTNFEMLGYYVMNNTGIGFRSFASGLLFGIGTMVITLYNGVLIGAVAGHLSGIGYNDVFWPFVVGHGAFELTAICISAAAGLALGRALLFPGNCRRGRALRLAAAESVPLVVGSALFFFIAAFIEAFWSPSMAPSAVKFGVGAALWLGVFLYLGLAGRGRDGS